MEKLSTTLHITPSLAKVLLVEHQWMNNIVVDKYRQNSNALLIEARIKPPYMMADNAIDNMDHNTSLLMPSTSNNSNNNSPRFSSVGITSKSSSNINHNNINNNNNSNNKSNQMISTTISSSSNAICSYRSQICPVCTVVQLNDKFYSLACGHSFCKDCWAMFFETQIFQVMF